MTTRGSGLAMDAKASQSHLANRRHVLDLDDFSREEIEEVLQNADVMKEVLSRDIRKVPTLRGKTIYTLFYEASTRTRASFEQAGKVMSADVINVSAGGSSVEKGESLYDTALTLQAMNADMIIMRHSHPGAPYFLARNLDAPIINAGDGAHGHPTQALLDIYTMQSHLGRIEGLKVAIVGDILYSRVVRSNLWGLTKMGAHVTLCGPPTLMPLDFLRGFPEEHPFAGVTIENSVDAAVEGSDVVMALRLQIERQRAGHLPSLREYSRMYGVNATSNEAGETQRSRHAPGPHERGGRDRRGCRARGRVRHRGAGDQRRCRADVPALQPRHVERERYVTAMADPQLRDRATAVVIRDGKVLLVHGFTPTFAMPGGGIEPGESPADAAQRELLEETSLKTTHNEFQFILETAIHRHHVFLVEAEGEVKMGPEISEFRWWDRKESLPIYSHVESILERL